MGLRGVTPDKIDKRLKMLLYGPAGTGKTTAAIQMPKPYLIDTERGAENDEYVAKLTEAGGAYLFLTQFDELIGEVLALMSEPHEYRTLIIDPLTVVYNDMVDQQVKRLARQERKDEDDPTIAAFGRPKATPDRKMKHLLTLLTRLDMNVIVTSHAKPKYEKAGDGFKEVGLTFDCYGKLDYLFDLVLELQKRGKDRYCLVKKSRIAGFPDGESFPISYDEIANRYGREHLERRIAAVTLATQAQLTELYELLQLNLVGADWQQKCLEKGQSETWEEMASTHIQPCIDFLKKKAKELGL